MAGRALTVLRLASVASRAVPLSPLIRLVEAIGARFGPRLMSGKARQLQRHIERVQIDGADPAGKPADADPAGRPADAAPGMRRGFGSYGRYWVESFRIPYLTDRALDRGFSFVEYGKIEEVRAAGFGPILVLPHLGGWEWAAAWLGRVAKVQVTAVVERLEPEEVFEWFSRLRRSFGVNVVPLGPQAMVELSAAVKRRDIVCLLSDRDVGGNGVDVRFFGETTTLPAGPALLSRRTGAPIMPAAVYFRGRQRICLVGDPIWPGRVGGANEEGRPAGGRGSNQRIMQVVADRFEELISQAPDQWHLLEPNWPSDASIGR